MKSPSNFERLVLGCIDSYDSESRRIFQDFSRSTRFTFLCTAQTSKFQENFFKKVKKFDDFFLNFLGLSGGKECKSCRSRKMLQNEYLVAIVAVHTAENEPLKI